MQTPNMTIKELHSDLEMVRVAPLSFVQEQLWFAEQLESSGSLYMETLGLRLHGKLSVETLERSLREIVRRHEILRTIFPLQDRRPIQQVLADTPITLTPPIDLSDISEAKREAELLRVAQDLVEQPCDLTRGPLFRCRLIRLADDDHALLVVAHHTIFDGQSMALLVRELNALYSAFLEGRESPLPEPELQYADFAEWERELLASGVLDEDIEYWTSRLAGAPAFLELPRDHRRPPTRRNQGWRDVFPLGDQLVPALSALSRRYDATVFTVALAAFAVVVQRYTGKSDFVLGTLFANRPRPELEEMIGLFVNTLPLRMDLSGDPTFAELLTRCRDRSLEAFDHQHLALEKLIEALRPHRDPSHSALIQHLFALKEIPVGEERMGDLDVTDFEVPRNRGRFDTIIEVEVAGDRLRAWVEYDTAIFDHETIAQLMRHYRRILAACVANPEMRISRLPMLDRDELIALTGPAELSCARTPWHADLAPQPIEEYRPVVLDASGQLVPRGVIGRLQLADPGTVESLIADPTNSSALPLYPTDQLARWNGQGQLEILGRIDEQVERSGLRILTSEIAAALAEHPQVVDAAIVINGAGVDADLVGYVQVQDQELTADKLASFVSERLPRYMVPAVFHMVPAIPRAANGVPDRAQLAQFHSATREVAAVPAPGDTLQAFLLDIWREVMEIDDLAPEDDFFELGGHSMLAARLVQQIHECLQIDLSLRTLFENPTVEDLTTELRRLYPGLDRAIGELVTLSDEEFRDLLDDVDASPDPGAQHTGERMARLTFSQEQFWVMEQIAPGRSVYTIPITFRIHGPLDVDALRDAINVVVARHESLRATVAAVGDVPLQRIAPTLTLKIPFTDLSRCPADERQAEAARLRDEVSHHVFDLVIGPLLLAHIVRLDVDEHLLLLNFHHLVSDEVSMRAFVYELSEIYKARCERREPNLPALRLSYTDYIAWEREHLSGASLTRLEDFWRRQLQQVPILDLPTDHPRPPQLTFDGSFLGRAAPASLFQAIVELAQRQQATPYSVVVAAVAELIHRLSGQDDFVIGAACENRNQPGSELIIASFVNMVPLRIDRSGEPTFLEFLRRVRNTLLSAYHHQSLPTTKIVEALRIPRQPNRLPLIQVSCELQLEGWLPLELPGCTFEYEIISHGTARYEMAFHALAKQEHLWLALELNTSLWNVETGHRLLADLEAGLAEIVENPNRPLSTYRFQATALERTV